LRKSNDEDSSATRATKGRLILSDFEQSTICFRCYNKTLCLSRSFFFCLWQARIYSFDAPFIITIFHPSKVTDHTTSTLSTQEVDSESTAWLAILGSCWSVTLRGRIMHDTNWVKRKPKAYFLTINPSGKKFKTEVQALPPVCQE